MFVDLVFMDGNMLLNIGLDGCGVIVFCDVGMFVEIGEWMCLYCDVVVGVGYVLFVFLWEGVYMWCGDCFYLSLFSWLMGFVYFLGFVDRVLYVWLLNDGLWLCMSVFDLDCEVDLMMLVGEVEGILIVYFLVWCLDVFVFVIELMFIRE